jgi:hypothetical protein
MIGFKILRAALGFGKLLARIPLERVPGIGFMDDTSRLWVRK